MLYETAARASEILALNIEDLDLDARRAPIRSKGGDTEWICWGSGTAHLLPRLIRGRQVGPVFLSERRPGPARRPAARDLCPATGRARLGYDRARILFTRYTGWDLHQLRHSAATHLEVSGIASDASFGRLREHAPPAAQRTALRALGLPGCRAGPGDQGLHGPPGSGATMMRLMLLRGVHHRCTCWHRDASGSSRLHRVHHSGRDGERCAVGAAAARGAPASAFSVTSRT